MSLIEIKQKLDLSKFEFGDNIAEKLNEESQTVISAEAVRLFELDLGSRAEWERRYAIWTKLFATQRDPKNFPWPNASNIGISTLSTAVTQFNARAVEAIVPPGDIVKPYFYGDEDRKGAVRVAKYMNWQLKDEMDDFEDGMDTTLMILPVTGCIFRKSYYDPLKQKVESGFISPRNLVINWQTRNLEKANRITQVLENTSINDIQRMGKAKFFVNTEELIDSSQSFGELSSEISEQENSNEGREPTEDTGNRVLLEQHTWLDLNNDGIDEPYIIILDWESRTLLAIYSREDYRTGEPINYFTQYDFIKNPFGAYGIGFGYLLDGAIEGIDTIINQLIDAGTAANLQTGVIQKNAWRNRRGVQRLKMGEFIEVAAPQGDVKKAITEFKFSEPSSVLFALMGKLQEFVDRQTTVTELLTGRMPSSDTPANTILALIEQGLKVFSSIHKRIHRSFKKELKKIYQLNGLYFNPVKYMSVLGDEHANEAEEASADFNKPFDIIPVSDPQIVTRVEKLSKAEAVWAKVLESPIHSQNPKYIDEAFQDLLKAMDIDQPSRYAILSSDDNIDRTAEEENAMALQGMGLKALPQQDHPYHIQSHGAFFSDPAFQQVMSPETQNLLMSHIREHTAFGYLQEVENGTGSFGTYQPVQAQTMGEQPNNEGIQGTTGGNVL